MLHTLIFFTFNFIYFQGIDNQEFLSGQHNWCITNHARPTFCNVCRDALPGVRSTGLSCEGKHKYYV